MIFLITHHKTGISTAELQRFVGIKRYQTCWTIAQKIRKAMADRNAKYKLEGFIETDDTVFGAKNVAGKRGRGADKKSNVIVSVVVNELEKPVFANMTVVENLKKDTVKDVLDKQIKTGQHVKTDGFKSYNGVKELGHKHHVIVIGNPKDASKLLPWVHVIIGNVKGSIRGVHHGVSPKYLKWYLAQYSYLFNRRFWFQQLFDRLLTACINSKTITFAELTV
jgi:transposase-like protein